MSDDQINKLDFVPPEIIDSLSITHPEHKFILPTRYIKPLTKASNITDKDKSATAYVDISAVRGDEIKKLDITADKEVIPSIIPKEFYIIKDEVKSYLEYDDHEPDSIVESEKKLVIFPTDLPQSRQEVIFLRKTLEQMLLNHGRPDDKLVNFNIESQNDIDKVMEIIEQLDQIYSCIFHELARQIHVSSDSRGSIVFELRAKYSDLIRKVPEELIKLKVNVKEQHLKDKDLTRRIENFQYAIKHLTEQLKEVKMRDLKVTQDAEAIHRELETALDDAKRSKELLDEYHILYDLQRQRLENQMTVINNEKEEWCSLALALCLKISDESLLNTTKRLRLITKKLFQLSQHFAIHIADRDTVLTSRIQDLSGQCLKKITKIHAETSKTLNNFFDIFHYLEEKFSLFTQGELNTLDVIKHELNALKEVLSNESLGDMLTDISLLDTGNYQSVNESIHEALDQWQSIVVLLANRRPIISDWLSEGNQPIEMQELFQDLNKWAIELSDRIALISTFVPFLHDLKCHIERIEMKINDDKLSSGHSASQSVDFESILAMINDLYLEMFENRDFLAIEKNEDFNEFNKFYNTIQKSVVAFSHSIDIMDASLMEHINVQQSKITDWMIEALFLLCQINMVEDIEMRFSRFSDCFQTIVSENNSIFQYVIQWLEKLSSSSEESEKQLEMSEYTEENNRWTNVGEILIKNIGEKIEQELLKRREKSEKEIGQMSLENIENLINQITNKIADKNMFLALETVKNLQTEISETQSRIDVALKNRLSLANTLEDQQRQTKELEEKIAEMTVEYREMLKTE